MMHKTRVYKKKYTRYNEKDGIRRKSKKFRLVHLNCDLFDKYVKNVSKKSVEFGKNV